MWTPDFGLLSKRGLSIVLLICLALTLVIATQPLRYAVAAIAGIAVLLITVIRPEAGLALVFFSVPFGTLAEITVGGLALTATEPLIAIVGLGWVLRLATAHEARVRLTPLFVPFVIYLFGIALALAVALYLRIAVKEFIKWFEAFLLMIMAANVLQRRSQVIFLVASALAAGTIAALQGWYQFIFRQGPEGFIIAGRFLRAYGTFGQPNPYAGYLGLVIPIAFAILFVVLTRGGALVSTADIRSRIFSSIALLFGTGALGLMLIADGMSLSRAAWFGLVAALLAIMALRSRKTFIGLLIAGVLGLLLTLLGALDLLPVTFTERLSILGDYFRIFDINEVELTPENWSIVERMATWQAAWDMFQSSPWYGVGPGAFQSLWTTFGDLNWILRGTNPPHAHNYYLNALAESGIVGLVSYVIFIVGAFTYMLRRIRGAQLRGTRNIHPFADPLALTLGGLGVLLALSVHNLFDNIYVHGMTAQLGLTLGLVEGAWNASDEGPEETPN